MDLDEDGPAARISARHVPAHKQSAFRIEEQFLRWTFDRCSFDNVDITPLLGGPCYPVSCLNSTTASLPWWKRATSSTLLLTFPAVPSSVSASLCNHVRPYGAFREASLCF